MIATDNYAVMVERIQQGDDSAMCGLIDMHGMEMKRMASGLVGKALQSHLDADDAVQTVHVAMWVGIRTKRFDVPTSDHFLALARTLLRRQVARFWRKAKSQRTTCLDGSLIDTICDQDLSAAAQPEPQQTLEVDEFLERFLGRLDETDQQLVKMRFLGYKTSEAARRLNLAPGYLRMRLIRLRQRFAHLWRKLKRNT